MSPAALLLVAALLVQDPGGETDLVERPAPEPTNGRLGWHCSAQVAIGRYRGSVRRDYDTKRRNSPYEMVMEHPEARHHLIRWTVDPRPGRPSAGRKRSPRSQADAFRAGPEFVTFYFEWRTEAVGPLWAHYRGDGAYVGPRKVMSARRVRNRYTGVGDVLGRPLVEKLGNARVWTASLRDARGKELESLTFRIPTPEEAQREFARARARIDALELSFRADHKPREEGDATCFDHAPAEGEI